MNGIERSRALAALGSGITPAMLQGTMALFAGSVCRPDSRPVVARDVRYGEDPRHRLDIFQPREPARSGSGNGATALIFVHGGGFIGGDKGAPEAPFYNNIGGWAARNGMVGVTMTYRLAPHSPWPAGLEDVASAVHWLRANSATYGIDERAIFVMGQSAGAVHVAGYVARQTDIPEVAGAILMSGIYDLVRLAHSPLEDAYFGDDPATFAERSSLHGLARRRVPCLYTIAQFDPERFQRQAAHVVEAHVALHGRWPRMHYLDGHNHLSPALAIGGVDDDIGPQLLSFIEESRPAEL